jgi:DNA-binding MarR family transcriptional regulator
MSASPNECAGLVLQVVPMMMRAIRMEMRTHRGGDLSVPQFRVLIFLSRNEGASLSDVAEHLGLTLPSMSKMIDGLVSREMVTRQADPGDRRRVTLTLTALGLETMHSAYSSTLSRLAERLGGLSPSELAAVVDAMVAMETIFAPDGERKARTTWSCGPMVP